VYTVIAADFNADGLLDLAVSNAGSNTLSVLLGTGTGAFGAAVNFSSSSAPYSLTSADFNADGKPDLAAVNNGSSNVSIFLNNTAHITAAGSTTFCAGNSVVLNANTNGYMYNWSPGGSTNSSLTVFSAGAYNVTLTSPSGCASTSNAINVSITTGIPAAPGTISGLITQCPALTNQSYSVSPVTNATGYNWSLPTGWLITAGNGTNAILVTTGATGQNGTISVTATSSCGTSTSSTLSVTVGQTLSGLLYTSNPVTFCTGATISPDLPTITGVPISYSVNPALPAGLVLNASTGVISGSPTTIAVTANYTVTATNSCGFTSASVNIAVIGGISGLVYASNPAVYCSGIAMPSNTPSSSGTPGSYSVSPALPGGISLNAASGVISGSPMVSASLASYTVTESNGCSSAPVLLNITINPGAPSSPGPISGLASVCPVLVNQTYSITPVTHATTYTWTVPTGWSITAGAGTNSISLTTGLSGQNGNITVTAENSCGISSAATLAVLVNPTPVVIAIASATTICPGGTVTLSGGGANTYSWTGGISNGVVFAPSATTTYTVTGTNTATGCIGTASKTITVSDITPPTITAPANVAATTNTACTATGVALGTPVTADNCSVASVINNAPANFPLGVTTVIWTVADGSGNTAIATQTVTVTDNVFPTISAPANVNAATNAVCSATGVALGAPVTADNCSVALVINNAPAAFPLGVTTVTWSVTDGSGNTATAIQTVTVADHIAPVPDLTSLPTISGICLVTLTAPTATDNCSGQITGTTSSPVVYSNPGSYIVTWSYSDGHGNSSSQTQTAIVAEPDTTVALYDATFTAQATGSGITYAWLNCLTNTLVAGETAQSFIGSPGGSYALVVSGGSCSDTSACYRISITSIRATEDDNIVSVFPNPNNGKFSISKKKSGKNQLKIFNSLGQIIYQNMLTEQLSEIDLSAQPAGIYFIQISTGENRLTNKRIIIE
jgi:hypothetical protein